MGSVKKVIHSHPSRNFALMKLKK